MSDLDNFLANHRTGCLAKQGFACTCGLDEARIELAELKQWKLAVDDACVTDWVPMTTPKETLASLISWNIKMALDPAISQEANNLIKQVEANYDALVKPMPCGHLKRYEFTENDIPYCSLCESQSLMQYLITVGNVANEINKLRNQERNAHHE